MPFTIITNFHRIYVVNIVVSVERLLIILHSETNPCRLRYELHCLLNTLTVSFLSKVNSVHCKNVGFTISNKSITLVGFSNNNYHFLSVSNRTKTSVEKLVVLKRLTSWIICCVHNFILHFRYNCFSVYHNLNRKSTRTLKFADGFMNENQARKTEKIFFKYWINSLIASYIITLI